MTTADQTTYVEAVALGKIVKHPDNPRHLVGDVTDLAASIKDHGVLEPLVVVPIDNIPADVKIGLRPTAAKEYALVAGHRRLAAAKDAKVKTVPVIVRYDLTTRDEQVAAMVIENQHRADLSPVEEGEAYQLLLDITPKPTQAKVAKAVGMPRTRISERVRLTKLGDQAKDAVHDGQITLTDALELLTIEQKHPQLAEQVTIAAGTKDFAYRLNRARLDAKTLDQYAAVRAHAEKLGTSVFEAAPGYGTDAPRRVGFNTPGIDVPTDSNDTATSNSLAVGTAHADCPGAAVYIPKAASGLYEFGWYCTEHADHHVPTAEERQEEHAARRQEQQRQEQARLADLTDEERAEQARQESEAQAAREAKEERIATLEAAQKTRWAHFTNVINKADPALAKWALLDSTLCVNGDYIRGEALSPISLWLLGLAEEEVTEGDAHSALGKLSLEQLALYSWFIDHGGDEDELRARYGWHIEPDPDYIAALTDKFGYQWSTVEIDEFGLDEHGHIPTDEDGEAAA